MHFTDNESKVNGNPLTISFYHRTIIPRILHRHLFASPRAEREFPEIVDGNRIF